MEGEIVITKDWNFEETQRANATPGDITERKKLVGRGQRCSGSGALVGFTLELNGPEASVLPLRG